MKRILFVDGVCPKPYDCMSLLAEGMGGTEATVIRVAESLGYSAKVTVAQKGRVINYVNPRVDYVPLDNKLLDQEWDSIVVLRSAYALPLIREKQPKTQILLWLHDLSGPYFLQDAHLLKELNIHLVAVSRFHLTDIISSLKTVLGPTEFPKMSYVYNPIDDALHPDSTPIDKNKLVFFSSPHKGLDYALSLFPHLKSFNPDFRLCISNPGYYPDSTCDIPGVELLGALPHHKALQHVRSALCVFYPNHVFPETFGLVLAEANAVGTPVLTHSIGAAREVLTNPVLQLCDTRVNQVVISRLMSWHGGNRPPVTGKDEFRLCNVTKRWQEILCSK